MTVQYTYDSTTIHEDFEDSIYVVSGNDTTFLRVLRREPCHDIRFDWPMDDIDNPTATVAQLEGFTVGHSGANLVAANTVRQRATNVTMITALATAPSHTSRHVREAGVEDQLSYAIAKKALEVLKQVEWNMIYSRYVAGASATAPQTAGLVEWAHLTGLDSNAATVAGTSIANTYSATRYVVASASTELTEANFQSSFLSPLWANGADISASLLFVGPNVKAIISKFATVYSGATGTSNSRWNQQATERTQNTAVDYYSGDYGTFGVVLNRRMTASTAALEYGTGGSGTVVSSDKSYVPRDIAIMVDPSLLKLRVLMPLQHEIHDGGGNRSLASVFTQCGLQVSNPKAIGIINRATGLH